eukprot:2906918-Pleurochrysis_carterae.AAC.1
MHRLRNQSARPLIFSRCPQQLVPSAPSPCFTLPAKCTSSCTATAAPPPNLPRLPLTMPQTLCMPRLPSSRQTTLELFDPQRTRKRAPALTFARAHKRTRARADKRTRTRSTLPPLAIGARTLTRHEEARAVQ